MKTSVPNIAAIPLPIDQWTQPFWDACAKHQLVVPRCAHCAAWRWPPTPFCPKCRSQAIEWMGSGPPRLYSFTVVRQPSPDPNEPFRLIAPGLVEFPEAGFMRFVAAIVDSDVDRIKIGSPLEIYWTPKDETNVPMFKVA